MTLEELKKEHSNTGTLLGNQQDALKNLFEELGFQQSIALYSHFCDVLDENMVIKYEGNNSSKREYSVRFKKEDGIEKELMTIFLKKIEETPQNIDQVTFNPASNYYDSLTNKDLYIKFSTIGKLAEIIYYNQKDLISLLNSTAEETREEIEKLNASIQKNKSKMFELALDHKILSFNKFKSDLESGVNFEYSVTFPKTLNKDLYVKRFKITHYSPSGKTVYFKYTIGWNSESDNPMWYYSEAMVEKIEDFFDGLYNGISSKEITSTYTLLDETPKVTL